MNSYSQKDNVHSLFTNRTPHFFKILLKEAIQDGKLMIPRNFVRKHGKLLSSPIKLEVPSGATWQVELTKCDDSVWLQKGWKEFLEYYSLELGDFLVFRYEGNAHFHVLIFDKSASEIEYPYTSRDDEDPVELCYDIPASRKSKEKSHLPCPRPCKKMRTDSPQQHASISEFKILSSCNNLDSHASKRIKLGNLDKVEELHCCKGHVNAIKEVGELTAQRSAKTGVFGFMQRMTATEKAHAFQRAGAFKSTDNPAFMVLMRSAMVGNDYNLSIPSEFVRKFLPMQNGSLTLCNSAGKTWPVKYYFRARNKNPSAPLNSGGWRVFAEDNNLDVGDICVFELIKHPKIVMKVNIYPNGENSNKARRSLTNGRMDGRVKCDQSPCPSNSKEFKDPKTEENENIDSDIEILDDFPLNQKTQKISSYSCFRSSKMMRTNESGSIQATKRVGEIPSLRSLQRLKATEKIHAMQKANASKSAENPVFMVVMPPSSVSDPYRVSVPTKFARKFLKMQAGDHLTLCNSTGKTWPVKYYHRLGRKGSQVQLRGGWGAFATDNNLDVGDICVFELIKHHEILMKVDIYPVVQNGVKNRSSLSDTEPPEIRCPSSSREFKDPKAEEGEDIDSDTEILDDFPLDQKTNKKQPSSCFGSSKTIWTKESGSIQATKGVGEIMSLKSLQRLNATEKIHAMRMANASKSTENPVFMVVMQPSFVSSLYRMGVPTNIARKFFELQTGDDLTLCNSTGKTWPVKYFCNGPQVQLRGGWRAFAKDNKLDVGDICVFELIKHHKILMKVDINPRSLVSDAEPPEIRSPYSSGEFKDTQIEENKNIHSCIEISDDLLLNQKYCEFKYHAKDDSGEKSDAQIYSKPDLTGKMQPLTPTDKVRALKSATPFFSVVMQPSSVRTGGNLWIPYKFAKTFFKQNSEVILRLSYGRTWVVGYKRTITCLSAIAQFHGKSWRKFVLDNNLKVGDICVFKLIKENGNILEVDVISAADIASPSSSKHGCSTTKLD